MNPSQLIAILSISFTWVSWLLYQSYKAQKNDNRRDTDSLQAREYDDSLWSAFVHGCVMEGESPEKISRKISEKKETDNEA